VIVHLRGEIPEGDAGPELDLDDIEEMSSAATPGPWFVKNLDDDQAMNLVAVSTVEDTGRARTAAARRRAPLDGRRSRQLRRVREPAREGVACRMARQWFLAEWDTQSGTPRETGIEELIEFATTSLCV
jgi:hypothetical protein